MEPGQTPSRDRDKSESKSAIIIAISGFLLSVFFILWAMIILVRFYVFDHLLYNLFLCCMMATGVVFNIFSINLVLSEITETIYVLPFVLGSPVTIFWTLLSILMPILKKNFYHQFAFMPIALYDASFYDGLGYDPNKTAVHPFAKPFMPENSFFEQTSVIIIILVTSFIAQLIFWMYSTAFYFKLKKEEIALNKIEETSLKTL